MEKLEEVGLLDAQIVAFQGDLGLFNTNRFLLTSDGTTVLSTDGLSLNDSMGLLSYPLQVIPDTSIQQVMTSEIVPETTTIYIDQSQIYLGNGQLVITDEGLLAAIPDQQQPIDKDSMFFASPVTISESMKPIGLNTLDLSCLATSEDLLLEPSAGLVQKITPAEELPASPSGEELVITGSDVSWKENTPQKNNPPPVPDYNKDIPPPLRKGPFKCEICLKEFPQYSQYRKHSQFHLEDKPHKCPWCTATFNIPTNLILHKATHQVDSLECPECLKKFSRVASLKAHIMLHEREESLFCTECGDEFGNQVQLDKHMRSHDEEWVKPAARVYQCPHCDKQYSRASVLRQHMKDHFKVKAALSANSYNRAVRRGRLLHSCSVCGKNFQKPSQLIRHNRIHTGERPFKCDLCTRSFNQKGSLLIHMMSKHKGMRPYQCQFCSAAFSQKGNLRAHVVRLHSIPNTQETVYQCSECSCVFRKLGSLNAHYNRMHPPTDPVTAEKRSVEIQQMKLKAQISSGSKDTSDKENDDQDEKNPPKLPQQRIITVSNKLEDGTVKHTKMKQRMIGSIKWHQCTYCGKEFKKPSDLVRHTRIHTQERPYKCKFCQRGFSIRSTLVSHMRTHAQPPKQFKCNTCEELYTSSAALKLHKKTEHPNPPKPKVVEAIPEGECNITIEQAGSLIPEAYQHPLVITDQGVMQVVAVKPVSDAGIDRPHRCMICGQAYRKSNHLKVHLRNHSGERPYVCNLCPRTFTSAGVLKAHSRTHTMLKTHRCNVCGKYLSTKGSLRRHTETHSLDNPFMCPYCPRTYKSHSACRKHIKTHKIILTHVTDQAAEQTEVLNQPEGETDLGAETEMEPTGEHVNVETMQSSLPALTTIQASSIPNIEALIVNRSTLGLDSSNVLTTDEQSYVISRVESLSETGVSQTLHADASGTITLSTQDALTQESIRELEETLNQQLFCTPDLQMDKEQVVLFDQGFESCVFPNITLQGEQLELGQALTSANLAGILPSTGKSQKLYSCEQCGEECKGESDLEAHRLTHLHKDCITLGETAIQLEEDIAAANLPNMDNDQDQEFRCDVCGHLAQNEEEFTAHRESHGTCDICDKTFATVAQYRAHIKSHGREKEYVCDHCGSSFSYLSSLARHINVHFPDEKVISCETCFQRFKSHAQMRRHVNSEHQDNKSKRKRGEVRQLTEEEAEQLATLEATSMSERVLKASIAERDRISDVKDPEMYKHEPQHANQCKYCPKSFRKPSDLVRHLRIHTGERPYQCDFCSKCFTVKSTLDSHLKTHNVQKRCICHVCGYYFATKGSLKVHMRLHTGSRPFRCPVCFQRFRTSGHRKAHLMLHVREAQPQLIQTLSAASETTTQQEETEGEQDTEQQQEMAEDVTLEQPPIATLPVVTQHQCNVCEKTFGKQSFLVRHMRVHTGEKPYKCTVCEKAFSQKNSLDAHTKIHTGERNWVCTECDAAFTQKCNLQTHMKRHRNPPPPHPYTIDLSEEKFPVDLEKVVSDLFPHMKPSKSTLGADEI